MWQDLAACADDPHPECWTPGRGDHDHIARAKSVCLACPVRGECLAAALADREFWTIRGGLTPNERKQLARA